MLNVRLAGDHQYRKLLFTCLSLVMFLMVSFCAFFFLRDVLDEIVKNLSYFLRVFLPTLAYQSCCVCAVWWS